MFIGGGILKEIYLDNSATTKVYTEAAKAAFEVMTENYGNPSSLHMKGVEAEKTMDVRVILKGYEDTVMEILNAYYN